jgi:ABC-2 type transport system permease protein
VRALRAFPTLVRVGFAESVAYRAEMLVWMLTTTMPLVSLALWSAVAEGAPVGSFAAKDFAAYFLVTLVVRQLTGSWVVWEINQEIRSGALTRRLLKPIHPLIAYSADNLGALPLRAALALPVGIAGALAAGGDLLRGDARLIPVFLLSLIGAWLINFFVMVLIGTLAFYMESSTAIFEIYLASFMVLSGYLVPLPLFPGWLVALSDALPFRYTVGFPVELAIGLLDPRRALIELGVQWGYAALSCALALAAWRRGVARFAAFGG